MSGYTPVFRSIYSGSLHGQWPAAAVMASLLPLCDASGRIDIHPRAIAAMTGWPLNLLLQGIEQLMAPDPESRSKEAEGRRLVLLDPEQPWGWQMVNFMSYREKARLMAKNAREVASGQNRERQASTAAHRRSPPLTAADRLSNTNTNTNTDADIPPLPPKGGDEVEQGGVAEVFDHWRQTWGHERAHLDPKRRKVIRAALAGYSVADLCRAISGYRNSPHHRGENDRATVYDDLGLFLRDAAHIDAGLRFAEQPPRTDLSNLTRKNVAAVSDWRPPEVRNAVG